jgi:hypothetical protein
MNQENGKTGTAAPVEMYRVKRLSDGFYLFKDFTVSKNSVDLRWHVTMAGEWYHNQAVVIAAAMMVLTGEKKGIDIEPV